MTKYLIAQKAAEARLSQAFGLSGSGKAAQDITPYFAFNPQ